MPKEYSADKAYKYIGRIGNSDVLLLKVKNCLILTFRRCKSMVVIDRSWMIRSIIFRKRIVNSRPEANSNSEYEKQ